MGDSSYKCAPAVLPWGQDCGCPQDGWPLCLFYSAGGQWLLCLSVLHVAKHLDWCSGGYGVPVLLNVIVADLNIHTLHTDIHSQ